MASVIKKKSPPRCERVSVLMTKDEVKAIKKYLGGNISISTYFRTQILERLRKEKIINE
jgi:hypothetical protein